MTEVTKETLDTFHVPELEIVGLHSSSNGRICGVHEQCGRSVKKGDVLRLVGCVVDINGASETAVKAVRVIDGVDTCTVGFVLRVLKLIPKVVGHLNKFVQVVELYENSDNTYKRSLAHRNSGVCSVAFLDDTYRNE